MAVRTLTMAQAVGRTTSHAFRTKKAADSYLKRSKSGGSVAKVVTNSTPHKTVGYIITSGQRNPTKAAKFPKGKFVKVQAVRVNRDGTITVKK